MTPSNVPSPVLRLLIRDGSLAAINIVSSFLLLDSFIQEEL